MMVMMNDGDDERW